MVGFAFAAQQAAEGVIGELRGENRAERKQHNEAARWCQQIGDMLPVENIQNDEQAKKLYRLGVQVLEYCKSFQGKVTDEHVRWTIEWAEEAGKSPALVNHRQLADIAAKVKADRTPGHS